MIDAGIDFFDRFTREYEQRFERTFGPLRGVVPKTVVRFFGCGLPEGGFARVRCDACGNEYHIAFSCHAFAGEEIPDIPDALRVGFYMVRGPAATSRLRADPAQEPKVRYLARGAIPDHGEDQPHPPPRPTCARVSS